MTGVQTCALPISDGREYWAFASQNFPPLVDESYYIAQATAALTVTPPKKGGTDMTPPVCNFNSTNSPCCANGHACGYFDTNKSGTAVFSSGYTVPAGPNNVIYVNGDAEFDNVAIQNATFIITGNLKISTSTTSNSLYLNVPVAAPQEYPELLSNLASDAGLANTSFGVLGTPSDILLFPDPPNTGNRHTQFSGFLYVKGNITVNAPSWNMVGTLLVGDMQHPQTGGQLIVPAGTRLNIVYDDRMNRAVHVYPVSGNAIKLTADAIQEILAQ